MGNKKTPVKEFFTGVFLFFEKLIIPNFIQDHDCGWQQFLNAGRSI